MALLPSAVAAAQVDDYPNRTGRVIVPFPPGGAADSMGRLIAAKLSESFGRQFVVDNRSGASGNIGTEMAARAAADGYTMLVNTLPFVVNQFLYKQLPYDPLNDFEPISLLVAFPSLLAVHPSVPARSVRELLELARSGRQAVNYGTAGPGTNPHIAGELFNYLGKVNLTAVHYKGGGPTLLATVSGEIGIAFFGLAETAAFVNSARLRALAVSGTKRSAAMPNVPTIAESGLPGYQFEAWQVLVAPKGTPQAIIAVLNDAVVKALRSADLTQRFREMGWEALASSPAECLAFLQSERLKWGRVVKERGMRAD
jgi:tripartite-type tricarboxylate transporter receptor subunit TctC